MKLGIAFLSSVLVVASGCAGARLSQFGATQDAAAPYDGLVSYYGYIAPGTQPDETRQNRPVHYVYLWLPNAAPELGLRVVSPTKDLPAAEGMAIKQPGYSANADGKEFFDPWVLLERCTTISNPAEVAQTCASWTKLGENDDSNELPEQPSGRKTNALLRVSSSSGDKAIERGLYRIGLGTAKKGEVSGTYLLQLGASGNLSGAVLAKTTNELRQGAR
ncbi:MAG: Lipl32 family lipoprotein [Myxococcota bacterium]|nr:Lipl32 family lipoprotein [Myxococcota bacterium]